MVKITLDAGECDLSDEVMVKIIDAFRRGDYIVDEGFTEEEAREAVKQEKAPRLKGFPECYCGGLFDMCPTCLRRQGDL